MKKIVALLLILLSFTFFAACGEEEKDEPSDTSTLEGDDASAEGVMWLMTAALNDPTPAKQYWQYKDGKLNTFYDNENGKYYYPADSFDYTLDEEAKTLTYNGYTYNYTLSEDGEDFRLECGAWWATFDKATVEESDFTAKEGNAGRFENSFIKYLFDSGLRSE